MASTAATDHREVHVHVAVDDATLRSCVTALLTDVFDDDSLSIPDDFDADALPADVDCVVVSASLLARVRDALDARTVPLVVLLPPDADRTAEAAFAAGAADVVPVDESTRFRRLGQRVASVLTWETEQSTARGRITEELKERAMDEAPVGITIADFSLPDSPLVYVNRAFTEATGYEMEEALGRNCRYLQGPETSPEAVSELREAIAARESASVELLNYRRDGSEFWNRVDIAPIEDESGEVTHYVGFQTDITARVRAEEAAERYAAVADRERGRLQRLLEHIEGVLEDVTGVLVRAENRAALEEGVCERVADTPSYGRAWIGDCDLAPDTVVPKVWAGEGTAAVDGLVVERDDTDDPVGRAVAKRTPRTGTLEGTVHADLPFAPSAAVAVPLLHRETLYGVLVIYTPEPVEDNELVVLGTVGRAVGAAIDAFESRRTLLTESVVELQVVVDDADAPLVRLATAAECSLASEGVVVRDDGTILLFVSATPADVDLEPVEGVDDVRRVGDDRSTGVFEVALPAGSTLAAVAEAGGRLTGLAVDPNERSLTLTVTVSDRSTGRALLSDLEGATRSVRVARIRERDAPPSTHRGFVAAVEEDLTEKQRTALQLAHVGGFFEWPHGISGDELAEAMGVSRSTFHQHLRAAERKLVGRFHRDT